MGELKTYRVEFGETGNVYALACTASGNLNELVDGLRSCENCTVTEYPSDRIQDLKSMQVICGEVIKK